jgi:hypothetical protein
MLHIKWNIPFPAFCSILQHIINLQFLFITYGKILSIMAINLHHPCTTAYTGSSWSCINITILSATFLNKIGSRSHSDPKFGQRGGGVSCISARKKVLERCSSLSPSGKELLKWRSSSFHHKNTPDYTVNPRVWPAAMQCGGLSFLFPVW